MYARVVYIDKYDKLFSSQDYYSNPLYDLFSPIDLTVFIGSMADNWKNFHVDHERRGAIVSLEKEKTSKLYNDNEWQNLHIIPKNTNIYKGIKTIRKGDIIKINGYLVDWQGLGDYSYFRIETARGFAEDSQIKSGGQPTGLCMQVYITQLVVNGYVYE